MLVAEQHKAHWIRDAFPTVYLKAASDHWRETTDVQSAASGPFSLACQGSCQEELPMLSYFYIKNFLKWGGTLEIISFYPIQVSDTVTKRNGLLGFTEQVSNSLEPQFTSLTTHAKYPCYVLPSQRQ